MPWVALLVSLAVGAVACGSSKHSKPPEQAAAPAPLRKGQRPAPERPREQEPSATPARCAQPFESGPCKAAFSVFWFNASTGSCDPRIYGGCGGNENRFESLEECEAACASPRE